MHFEPSVQPADFPKFVTRFLDLAERRLWEKRSRSLNEQVQRHHFRAGFLHRMFELELAMGHLLSFVDKQQGLPLRITSHEQHRLYTFISMAAMVHQRLPRKAGHAFSRVIAGALKSEHGLASIDQELAVAAQLMSRGFDVTFHELLTGTSPDLIGTIDDLTIAVECKTVDADAGRKIHRLALADLGQRSASALAGVLSTLAGGHLLKVTLRNRLERSDDIQSRVRKCMVEAFRTQKTVSDTDLCFVSYHHLPLSPELEALSRGQQIFEHQLRELLRSQFNVDNASVFAIGRPDQGILVVAVQSAKKDKVMVAVVDQLKKARSQLDGHDIGIVCLHLIDLEPDELLQLGENQTAKPSALQIATSRFLASANSAHIHSVAFGSRSGLVGRQVRIGTQQTRVWQAQGPAYVFRFLDVPSGIGQRLKAAMGPCMLTRLQHGGQWDGAEGCVHAGAWFEGAMEACRATAGHREAAARAAPGGGRGPWRAVPLPGLPAGLQGA